MWLAQRRRRAFVAARQPLSHREFCDQVGVTGGLRPWVVAVRRAMARLCVVPACVLYPNDTWRDLVRLVDCDWDDMAFVLSLETVGVEFPSLEAQELPGFLPGRLFWIHWPAPATFGLWSMTVAVHLTKHDCRQTRR